MRFVRIKIAAYNAPESGKRGLLRDRLQRAKAVLAWFVGKGVDFAVLQESGTFMIAATKASRLWRSAYATFNTLVHGGAWGRGNGMVWRYAGWRVRDRATIRVQFRVGKGRFQTLSLPVRLFEHRETRARFVLISVHVPTRRADAINDGATRAAMNRAISEYVEACGWVTPIIVGGDFNGRPELTQRLSLLAKGTPDWILGREVKAVQGGEESVDLPNLSDHHALLVAVDIPVVPEAITSLP